MNEQFGYYAQGVEVAKLPVRPEVRDRITGFVRPWRGDDQGR